MATKKSKTRKVAKKTTLKRVSTKTNASFWRIEFSVSTVYWLAIGIGVISIAVWTYNTNQVTNEIYDQIAERTTDIDNTSSKKAPQVEAIPTETPAPVE